MFLKSSLFFVLFIVGVYGYHDCSDKPGNVEFLSVKIDDCDVNKGRCVVKRGTDIKVAITFTAKADFNKVNVEPYFLKGDERKYITLDNYNACSNSGIACPIKENETYTYQTLVSIYKMIGNKDIKWVFQDENKNGLFCVMVLLESVD
ncbi:hypothetical protein Zmor_021201 [Zophobas morio]|uniref:MD-2-related lipid-recognition domain-containing protein n=1 Tax=Zophobas morio TaxID=2755281 RepID=A0AA38MAB9_9CUCU|nr:hypothetical protein Zmor_021201 [Zophobas morio]